MLPGLGDSGREPVRVVPLRMLLGGVTALMLAAFSSALLWDLSAGPSRLDALLFVLVATLAGSAAVIFSLSDPTVGRLRMIERVVFGAVVTYLGASTYVSLFAYSAAGDAEALEARWATTLIQFILLIVAYGTAVPNTWPRAARVTTAMALVPPGVVIAIVFRAEVRAPLAAVATAPRLAQASLALSAAVVIATVAAYVINEYLELAGTTRISIRYVLKRRIGVGGMGEVWLGEHNLLARPAAIKLIRGEALAGKSEEAAELLLRRFEREAQATAQLRSPHTVEIYDFGVTSDGTFYYAMEYLDGLDLQSLVRQYGPIPPERAVHLLEQVCQSLAEAHAQGLTHRDIKPANIFTCRLGTACDFVKLLDFGLVKAATVAGGEEEVATDLTLEGEVNGTPGYMAPETILAGQEPDARADLYAVGCVGYYLLTGTAVFEGPPLAVLVEHARGTPTAPSTRVETPIPTQLDRVILKCLDKDPAGRYQSASELAEALLEACPAGRWRGSRAVGWWTLHRPGDDSSDDDEHRPLP